MATILYGRDLSPFARRVAVWAALQGVALERRPLMVNGPDFETLKTVNPMGRVPILMTEDGEALIETAAIIDFLEEQAPAEAKLIPVSGAPRREVLQTMAYGHNTVEKGVALVYEKNRRPEEFQWPEWRARLEGQITGGLDEMESRAPADGFAGGDRPNGADVCLTLARDFIQATNPYLLDQGYPKLTALAARCNAMAEFGASNPTAPA